MDLSLLPATPVECFSYGGAVTPRNVVVGGLVLATGALLMWSIMPSVVQAQECPNPRLIDEIEGSGSQESPPFETTTDSFRVSYDTTADIPDAPFFLTVEGEGRIAGGNVSREGSATGETFVSEPPGRYSLNINTTNGMQYTIRIEECGEGGEANPGEGKSGEGTALPKTKTSPAPKTPSPSSKTPSPSPKTPSPPPKTPPPSPKAPSAPQFKAGGAEGGPVPLMKGGSCPNEYPERRGNACYA